MSFEGVPVLDATTLSGNFVEVISSCDQLPVAISDKRDRGAFHFYGLDWGMFVETGQKKVVETLNFRIDGIQKV